MAAERPTASLMHVVATAGHVDHGKSALVRALTGIEPDRWEEERRRGMTIDLGFAWTVLPSGQEIAFVDVPGHERFVSNMLAGVGPVPAVMLVIAADSGWMPQTEEHVGALDALGVRHGVVVVTRCDLADAVPVMADARARLDRTSMAGLPVVAASALTGAGVREVRAELDGLVARMERPDAAAPVRLWIDRSFIIRGAGTVVTGTLGAGTVCIGDELKINAGAECARVRAIQTLERSVEKAGPVSRVALNLRGVDRERIQRGDALTSRGPWVLTSLGDVAISKDVERLPREAVLHVGSAAVAVRIRRLGDRILRLSLERPLPLAVGDRALLRNPGQHAIIAGVDLLDLEPTVLAGRGSARIRADELAGRTAHERWETELLRRTFIDVVHIERLGLEPFGDAQVDGWFIDPATWAQLPDEAVSRVRAWEHEHPLEHGISRAALTRQLALPAPVIMDYVIARTPLMSEAGRIATTPRGLLPLEVESSIRTLESRWRADPFYSPDVPELHALRLGASEQAAAGRSGRVLVVAKDVVLSPGVVDAASVALLALPGPFTLSEARKTLSTSRRVAVPLLEHMDSTGRTDRISPELRRVVLRER